MLQDVQMHDVWPDQWQGSLFGWDEPDVDPQFTGIRRIHLDDRSWVDHLPGWMRGADVVFAELVARVTWRQRQVVMYDRLLPEPRLTAWWTSGDHRPELLPILGRMRVLLGRRYEREFDSTGCNYYRDGDDSVAWHGDRVRHLVDPVVAIVSVGEPRPFLMRPKGGGPSTCHPLGHGDLLVMGGECQTDWEHSVPKLAAAGPRISITYRHGAPPPPAAQ